MQDITDEIHPILENAFQYKIIGFNFQKDKKDPNEDFIILSLQKDDEIIKLIFHRPSDIYIEDGFPDCSEELFIYDTKKRGWENINILVTSVDSPAKGGIHFYSKSVALLESTKTNE